MLLSLQELEFSNILWQSVYSSSELCCVRIKRKCIYLKITLNQRWWCELHGDMWVAESFNPLHQCFFTCCAGSCMKQMKEGSRPVAVTLCWSPLVCSNIFFYHCSLLLNYNQSTPHTPGYSQLCLPQWVPLCEHFAYICSVYLNASLWVKRNLTVPTRTTGTCS